MKKKSNTTEPIAKRANKTGVDHVKGIIDDADVIGSDAFAEEVGDDLDVNETEDEGVNYYRRGGGYDFDVEEEAEALKQDGRYTIARY